VKAGDLSFLVKLPNLVHQGIKLVNSLIGRPRVARECLHMAEDIEFSSNIHARTDADFDRVSLQGVSIAGAGTR
jgi:hypothetical protein